MQLESALFPMSHHTSSLLPLRGLLSRIAGSIDWEEKRHHRSMAILFRGTAELNASSVLADDAVGDPEAQSDAGGVLG